MKLLLATKNKAKINYFGKKLKERGIDIVTLDELGIDIDVEETGITPIENATIKAKAYSKLCDYPTLAIDDCLYLNNVDDSVQPGTNVRRVNGKRLNDEEMITYYISLVNKYGTNNELKGYFWKACSIVYKDEAYAIDYKVDRVFTNRCSSVVYEGYPLASIQWIPKFNKFKSELNDEESKIVKDVEHEEIFDFILKTFNSIQNMSSKEKILK